MDSRTPAVADTVTTRESQAGRLEAIDLLRGLVIVLMVLDHTREYFFANTFDPTDPRLTTWPLFWTRWMTHLCAPTFVFLAGASIRLQRSKSLGATLSLFLATRGLWLIALELTVISFGFNFAWPYFFLQVIWAIGASMIAMSLLVWVTPAAVGLVGVAALAASYAVSVHGTGAPLPLQTLLLSPGPFPFGPGLVAYPLVPWFGILCIGYGTGRLWTLPAPARRRTLLVAGLCALGTFVAVRVLHLGDPSPWARQASLLRSALSFLDVSKYPPSPAFVLVTLGVVMTLTPWLERLRAQPRRVLIVLGRTPFFTYLLHIFLVHGLSVALGLVRGMPIGAFAGYLRSPAYLKSPDWGIPLAAVYLLCALVIAAIYPAAAWFAGYRQAHRTWWLRYL